MIRFLIRKTLYNWWDNLFQILLLNVLIIGIAFTGVVLSSRIIFFLQISILVIVCVILLEGVLLFAVSTLMARVASYSNFSFKDLPGAIAKTWIHGLLFTGLCIGSCVFSAITIRYYFQLGNIFGFALAVVIGWITIIVLLSLQWFLPIRSQIETDFIKCLKKSFIIFFDNPAFSIYYFFFSLVTMLFSLIFAGLIPGISGLILANNEAFRLRMYKYDWFEKNPGIDIKAARKMIPWDELLAKDKQTVGRRNLKSLIFPWKD